MPEFPSGSDSEPRLMHGSNENVLENSTALVASTELLQQPPSKVSSDVDLASTRCESSVDHSLSGSEKSPCKSSNVQSRLSHAALPVDWQEFKRERYRIDDIKRIRQQLLRDSKHNRDSLSWCRRPEYRHRQRRSFTASGITAAAIVYPLDAVRHTTCEPSLAFCPNPFICARFKSREEVLSAADDARRSILRRWFLGESLHIAEKHSSPPENREWYSMSKFEKLTSPMREMSELKNACNSTISGNVTPDGRSPSDSVTNCTRSRRFFSTEPVLSESDQRFTSGNEDCVREIYSSQIKVVCESSKRMHADCESRVKGLKPGCENSGCGGVKDVIDVDDDINEPCVLSDSDSSRNSKTSDVLATHVILDGEDASASKCKTNMYKKQLQVSPSAVNPDEISSSHRKIGPDESTSDQARETKPIEAPSVKETTVSLARECISIESHGLVKSTGTSVALSSVPSGHAEFHSDGNCSSHGNVIMSEAYNPEFPSSPCDPLSPADCSHDVKSTSNSVSLSISDVGSTLPILKSSSNPTKSSSDVESTSDVSISDNQNAAKPVCIALKYTKQKLKPILDAFDVGNETSKDCTLPCESVIDDEKTSIDVKLATSPLRNRIIETHCDEQRYVDESKIYEVQSSNTTQLEVPVNNTDQDPTPSDIKVDQPCRKRRRFTDTPFGTASDVDHVKASVPKSSIIIDFVKGEVRSPKVARVASAVDTVISASPKRMSPSSESLPVRHKPRLKWDMMISPGVSNASLSKASLVDENVQATSDSIDRNNLTPQGGINGHISNSPGIEDLDISMSENSVPSGDQANQTNRKDMICSEPDTRNLSSLKSDTNQSVCVDIVEKKDEVATFVNVSRDVTDISTGICENVALAGLKDVCGVDKVPNDFDSKEPAAPPSGGKVFSVANISKTEEKDVHEPPTEGNSDQCRPPNQSVTSVASTSQVDLHTSNPSVSSDDAARVSEPCSASDEKYSDCSKQRSCSPASQEICPKKSSPDHMTRLDSRQYSSPKACSTEAHSNTDYYSRSSNPHVKRRSTSPDGSSCALRYQSSSEHRSDNVTRSSTSHSRNTKQFSRSPECASKSTHRQSESAKHHLESPRDCSKSPELPSKSLKNRSKSTRYLCESPRRSSKSRKRRSRSRERNSSGSEIPSESPKRRSGSPAEHSSPRCHHKKSKHRSRSPECRSVSPKSPRRRSTSPRSLSRSPRHRSRSPKCHENDSKHRSSPMHCSVSPRQRSKSIERSSGSPKGRAISPEHHSRSDKRRSRSIERRSRSPKRRSRSPKRRSRSPKRRSKSPKRRSKSPKRRSRSPKRRSRSPTRRSKSPKRRLRSPKRRSRSPKCRSRSPTRRSRSPKRRSRSPKRHSRSPKRRSRSPKRRSRSPKRHSRSPKRRSRSPKRRSRSPKRRSRSPKRRSRSPKRQSRSPKRRSRSPKRRSRSPKRRSRSPRRHSRSPKRRSRSPKRRSRSPRRHSRSPKRRSRSPKRHSRSPRRRSRSPGQVSHSPVRRSRSPKYRNRGRRRASRSPRKRSRSPSVGPRGLRRADRSPRRGSNRRNSDEAISSRSKRKSSQSDRRSRRRSKSPESRIDTLDDQQLKDSVVPDWKRLPSSYPTVTRMETQTNDAEKMNADVPLSSVADSTISDSELQDNLKNVSSRTSSGKRRFKGGRRRFTERLDDTQSSTCPSTSATSQYKPPLMPEPPPPLMLFPPGYGVVPTIYAAPHAPIMAVGHMVQPLPLPFHQPPQNCATLGAGLLGQPPALTQTPGITVPPPSCMQPPPPPPPAPPPAPPYGIIGTCVPPDFGACRGVHTSVPPPPLHPPPSASPPPLPPDGGVVSLSRQLRALRKAVAFVPFASLNSKTGRKAGRAISGAVKKTGRGKFSREADEIDEISHQKRTALRVSVGGGDAALERYALADDTDTKLIQEAIFETPDMHEDVDDDEDQLTPAQNLLDDANSSTSSSTGSSSPSSDVDDAQVSTVAAHDRDDTATEQQTSGRHTGRSILVVDGFGRGRSGKRVAFLDGYRPGIGSPSSEDSNLEADTHHDDDNMDISDSEQSPCSVAAATARNAADTTRPHGAKKCLKLKMRLIRYAHENDDITAPSPSLSTMPADRAPPTTDDVTSDDVTQPGQSGQSVAASSTPPPAPDSSPPQCPYYFLGPAGFLLTFLEPHEPSDDEFQTDHLEDGGVAGLRGQGVETTSVGELNTLPVGLSSATAISFR